MGTTLYLADESMGAIAYNISNPTVPVLIGTATTTPALGIAATEQNLYVGTNSGVEILAISGGAFSSVTTATGSRMRDLELHDGVIYGTNDTQVVAVDVTNPTAPVTTPLIETGLISGETTAVTIVGSTMLNHARATLSRRGIRGALTTCFTTTIQMRRFATSDFMYYSCMATKTITLELDAYEKLRRFKRSGESFSEAVRRAEFTSAPPTGAELRAYYRAGGSRVSEAYLRSIEEASAHDPIPDDPWA